MAIGITTNVYASSAYDEVFFTLNDINYYTGVDEDCLSPKSSVNLSGADNVEKVWNFLKGSGFSDAATAGIIGNFFAESGVNPKVYEAINSIPDRHDQVAKSPTVEDGLGVSWAKFTSLYSTTLNESGYLANGDGKHYMGVGLGQWTGPRNVMIWEFADKSDKLWDLGTQLDFMLNHDVETRRNFLESFKTFSGTPTGAAQSFMRDWEGVNYHLEQRISAANDIYNKYKDSNGSGSVSSYGGYGSASSSEDSGELNGGSDEQKTSSITFIGDSITNGMRQLLLNKFNGSTVDAFDGRKIKETTSGGDPVITYLKKNSDNLGDILVINIGANDNFPINDAKEMLDLIKDKKVYLVNSFSLNNNAKYSIINSNIEEVAKKYDNVKVLDWASKADSNGGREKLYSDGVHLNNEGMNLYVEFLESELQTNIFTDFSGGGCSTADYYGSSSEASRVTKDGYTIFLQTDPEWKDIVYFTPSGYTIGAAGCGPTSFAMIATSFGVKAGPVEVAKKASALGQVVAGAGAAGTQAMVLAKEYGLKAEIIPATVDAMNERLEKGQQLWVGGRGKQPPFTAGGHMIVVRKKLSNGKWLIANPFAQSVEEDDIEWDPYDVVNHMNMAPTAVWK